MKKLKKFVLHDSIRLSREEMASVEGMDICLVDYCTAKDQLCIYSQSYENGHTTIVVGTCHERTENVHGTVVTVLVCD